MTQAIKNQVGRKGVVCAVASALVSFVLIYSVFKSGGTLSNESFATYSEFIKWIVGIFVFGNAAEHLAKKDASK